MTNPDTLRCPDHIQELADRLMVLLLDGLTLEVFRHLRTCYLALRFIPDLFQVLDPIKYMNVMFETDYLLPATMCMRGKRLSSLEVTTHGCV